MVRLTGFLDKMTGHLFEPQESGCNNEGVDTRRGVIVIKGEYCAGSLAEFEIQSPCY